MLSTQAESDTGMAKRLDWDKNNKACNLKQRGSMRVNDELPLIGSSADRYRFLTLSAESTPTQKSPNAWKVKVRLQIINCIQAINSKSWQKLSAQNKKLKLEELLKMANRSRADPDFAKSISADLAKADNLIERHQFYLRAPQKRIIKSREKEES